MEITDSSFAKKIVVLSFILPIAGCGGAKSNTSGSSQVSIKLNQSTATVVPGQTQQFTATVTGTDNTAVTWTVDNVSGGNSQHGTISNAGLYTAPPQSGTHTVTATSVADTSKSASATVTVQGNVAVTPGTANVVAGAKQQFQAIVGGQANSNVTWAVDGIGGGNGTVGTISSAGLYTAPSQLGSHTITAATGTDAPDSATAAVTVFTFGISPTSASLGQGGTQQFTVTFQGLTNTGVTWSVDGVAGGDGTTGTISATGSYTAPAQNGTHAVAAIIVFAVAADAHRPMLQGLLMAVGIVLAAAGIWSFVEFLKAADTHQQLINHDATSFAFAASLVLTLAFGLLQRFGFLLGASLLLPALMIALWSIGLILFSWRYQE